MMRKRTSRPRKRGSTGGSAAAKTARAKAPSVAARLPPFTAARVEAAKRKFVKGVVARGEAVPVGKPLPPGATHEIVGVANDLTPILKRNRFSLT